MRDIISQFLAIAGYITIVERWEDNKYKNIWLDRMEKKFHSIHDNIMPIYKPSEVAIIQWLLPFGIDWWKEQIPKSWTLNWPLNENEDILVNNIAKKIQQNQQFNHWVSQIAEQFKETQKVKCRKVVAKSVPESEVVKSVPESVRQLEEEMMTSEAPEGVRLFYRELICRREWKYTRPIARKAQTNFYGSVSTKKRIRTTDGLDRRKGQPDDSGDHINWRKLISNDTGEQLIQGRKTITNDTGEQVIHGRKMISNDSGEHSFVKQIHQTDGLDRRKGQPDYMSFDTGEQVIHGRKMISKDSGERFVKQIHQTDGLDRRKGQPDDTGEQLIHGRKMIFKVSGELIHRKKETFNDYVNQDDIGEIHFQGMCGMEVHKERELVGIRELIV